MKIINKNILQISNENGFASIIIGLILIIVLSLLTVAFSELSRREQQNALNKQLNVQAKYAAESGINDAVNDIKTGAIFDNTLSGGSTDTSTSVCMTGSTGNSGTTQGLPANALTAYPDINAFNGVSYTCLLVNLKPPNIQYDNVPPKSDRYITFSTSTAVASFNIFWGSAVGNNAIKASLTSGFTQENSWGNSPAVLEVSITPLSLGTDRQSLINNTYTAFLYPTTGPNITTFVTSDDPANGNLVSGNCNPSLFQYRCSSIINLPSTTGTGPYLMHIYDYYDTSDINITGTPVLPGTPVLFVNGQDIIDVTGKAKNVLKRIQVHLQINPKSALPNFALEGQNVCKQFDTFPSSTSTQNSNPACALN